MVIHEQPFLFMNNHGVYMSAPDSSRCTSPASRTLLEQSNNSNIDHLTRSSTIIELRSILNFDSSSDIKMASSSQNTKKPDASPEPAKNVATPYNVLLSRDGDGFVVSLKEEPVNDWSSGEDGPTGTVGLAIAHRVNEAPSDRRSSGEDEYFEPQKIWAGGEMEEGMCLRWHPVRALKRRRGPSQPWTPISVPALKASIEDGRGKATRDTENALNPRRQVAQGVAKPSRFPGAFPIRWSNAEGKDEKAPQSSEARSNTKTNGPE